MGCWIYRWPGDWKGGLPVISRLKEGRYGLSGRVGRRSVILISCSSRRPMGWSSGGTLVAHGALDRALPVAHAEALANGIDGSSLRIIDEMGHIPRHGDWLAIAVGIASLVSESR